jgi:hypothetical protein
MRHALHATFLLVLSTFLGCGAAQSTGADDFDIPPPALSEHHDAIRLNNGTVNLIIVPSLGGRIMRYGYSGGPNVLWTNPDATSSAQSPDLPTATMPAIRPSSMNYGGDKAWPWPQDEWPRLIGRTYPPPHEADQAVYRSRLLGSHGVRLESPPIPSHAARIVREIILDPAGTRVTIVTRLVPTGGGGDRPPPSMAAWSITQIPGEAKLFARMLPGGRTKPMAPAATPPATTRPVNDRVISVHPPVPRAAKLGLDADVLAAALDSILFVQRSPTASAANEPGYRATERAQIFCQKSSGATPQYLELEFTSPRRDLAAGEVPELRVVWELRDEPKGWTDERVAAFLLNDTPEPANLRPQIDVP